jgi:hypothetical protein
MGIGGSGGWAVWMVWLAGAFAVETTVSECGSADLWGLVAGGDVLVVDVFQVGVVSDGGLWRGCLPFEDGAGSGGPHLVLLLGDGPVDCDDAGGDFGVVGEELGAGPLGGLIRPGIRGGSIPWK